MLAQGAQPREAVARQQWFQGEQWQMLAEQAKTNLSMDSMPDWMEQRTTCLKIPPQFRLLVGQGLSARADSSRE